MLFLTIVCIDDGILLLVGVGVEEIGGEGRGGGGWRRRRRRRRRDNPNSGFSMIIHILGGSSRLSVRSIFKATSISTLHL